MNNCLVWFRYCQQNSVCSRGQETEKINIFSNLTNTGKEAWLSSPSTSNPRVSHTTTVSSVQWWDNSEYG